MVHKLDRRIKKTTTALKKAYIRLMEEYEEKEITVSMITQHADLNRATFYTHYSNKAEFLEEILFDALEGLKEEIMSAFVDKSQVKVNQLTPTTKLIFDYIEKNKKTFYVLYVGHPNFKNNLEDLFFDIFTNDIIIETKSTFGHLNYDIFIHYQTSATLGLILHWIKSKFEFPSEYMMKQLTILSNTQIINLKRK